MSDPTGARSTSGPYLHEVEPACPVWVDLRHVFPVGTPIASMPDGLDLTGMVPGLLSVWSATTTGHWAGLVSFMLDTPGSGGTPQRQWILSDALHPRSEVGRDHFRHPGTPGHA
ncbi:hypothetical protein [Amycolatopsis keratiniphila]|uniref:Uncharacterized protein n=1 Tax=Amycolatopsis keratiniphila TaxID=129921 RepID=R4T3D6_9PSEU|nr:hypothetical protein [Amycolatopsis keratiniphila]AGM10124.1 hypothetical protein AORI_7542 [Amycolatopsis keratiniphila]